MQRCFFAIRCSTLHNITCVVIEGSVLWLSSTTALPSASRVVSVSVILRVTCQVSVSAKNSRRLFVLGKRRKNYELFPEFAGDACTCILCMCRMCVELSNTFIIVSCSLFGEPKYNNCWSVGITGVEMFNTQTRRQGSMRKRPDRLSAKVVGMVGVPPVISARNT